MMPKQTRKTRQNDDSSVQETAEQESNESVCS